VTGVGEYADGYTLVHADLLPLVAVTREHTSLGHAAAAADEDDEDDDEHNLLRKLTTTTTTNHKKADAERG
jgi:hypothetical protein